MTPIITKDVDDNGQRFAFNQLQELSDMLKRRSQYGYRPCKSSPL